MNRTQFLEGLARLPKGAQRQIAERLAELLAAKVAAKEEQERIDATACELLAGLDI